MNRFTWVLLFLGFLGTSSLNAQNQNNVLKWNAGGLLDLGLSFDFERVIKDNHSIQIELHGGLPRKVPEIYTDGFTTVNENEFNPPYVLTLTKSQMWSVGLIFQYRFYPMRKHAPRGFFVGPYVKAKYRNMVVKGDYRNAVEYAVADINANVITVGGGMHFGYQFILGKHFSFEFGAGIGLDYHLIAGNLKSNGTNENYDSWAQKTENAFSEIPVFGRFLDAKDETTSAKIGRLNDAGEIKMAGVPYIAVHPMVSFGYIF